MAAGGRVAGRRRTAAGPGAAANEVAAGDLVLTLDGGVLDAADRRLAGRLRPAAGRPGRPRAAGRGRCPGRSPGRGQPDADRAAGRGRSRPADPPGGGQGVGLQPAQRRRRAGRRGRGRAAGRRRRVAGRAGATGRQPPRHEPAAGRRDDAAPADRRPSRTSWRRRSTRSSPTGPGARPPAVEVDVAPGLAVRCDAGLLERVLANLVGNALRHGGAVAGRGDREPARTDGRDPGRRPGPGGGTGRPRGPVRAVPALRRHRQHHRDRPRPGPLARPDRGDGWHADPRGHPGRWPDDGGVADRGRRGDAGRRTTGAAGEERT